MTVALISPLSAEHWIAMPLIHILSFIFVAVSLLASHQCDALQRMQQKCPDLLRQASPAKLRCSRTWGTQRAMTPGGVLALASNETELNSFPTSQLLHEQEQQVITTITSIPQFLSFVKNPDLEEQLCVIKYHAKWCKICKLVALKYQKLARDFCTTQEDHSLVRFGDVEVTANSDLCKKLGITLFPFIEIYEGGVRIAAFSTGASYKFNNILRKSMEEKLKMSKEEKLAFFARYSKEITQANNILNSLYDQH